MPERDLLKAVLDYLAAEHVLAFRMAVGATTVGNRFFRWGTPGMADVIAFPVWHDCGKAKMGSVLWLETKTAKGKQSPLQRSFQLQVEEYGHRYAIIRSLDDLISTLAK
jgi:hypothetical protein